MPMSVLHRAGQVVTPVSTPDSFEVLGVDLGSGPFDAGTIADINALRMFIPAADLSTINFITDVQIRVTARPSEPFNVTDVSFGIAKEAASESPDLVETPARITFGSGNNGVSIAAGNDALSDIVTLNLPLPAGYPGIYLTVEHDRANNWAQQQMNGALEIPKWRSGSSGNFGTASAMDPIWSDEKDAGDPIFFNSLSDLMGVREFFIDGTLYKFDLDGAAADDHRTLANAGAVDGQEYPYRVEESGVGWEVGKGVYHVAAGEDPAYIERLATPLASSNGGAQVAFTSPTLFVDLVGGLTNLQEAFGVSS